MAAVCRLYHPTQSSRIDVFTVDQYGSLIQYATTSGFGGFGSINVLASQACDGQATPVAEWNGSGTRLDIWVPTNGGVWVFHWWWTSSGGAGSETLS